MKYILFFLVIVYQSNKSFGQDSNGLIKSKIDSIYSNSNMPGFTVSVLNADGPIFQSNHGFSDIENSIEMNETHSILIASLSKTFLGVCIMKGIEDGYFELESNVNDLLPFKITNPYYPNTPIKIKHLVTHTSGISDNLIDSKKIYFIENPLENNSQFDKKTKKQIRKALKNEKATLKDLLSNIFIPGGEFYKKRNFNKHAPGEHFEYSNSASALAALIIESQSGISYEKYLKTNILDPLGMSNTSFQTNELNDSVRAILYTSNENIRLTQYFNLLYPIGGLYSNSLDMNKFLSEMIKGLNGKGNILTNSSYKTMFSKQLSTMPTGMKPDEINQGVFWVFNDENTIGHTGGGLGASAFMFFDTSSGLGKIFITNCELTTSQKRVNDFISIWYLMDEITQK